MVVDESTKQDRAATPDIDSALTDDWPRRAFPIRGQGHRNVVQVVVKRSVLNKIREHGLSRTDVEVCGVLVGDCYQDERGPFIYVEAMICGEHSQNQAAQVTFTAETWNHIQNEMDQRFEGQRILGWYHTHPGFGIFLSAMDLFIHENFFNAGEQLALVYDPLGRVDGLFVWHDGNAELYQYLVEEDSETAPATGAVEGAKPKLTAAARMDADDVTLRLGRLERRQGVFAAVLAVITIVAIGWPFLSAWLDLPALFAKPHPAERHREAWPPAPPRPNHRAPAPAEIRRPSNTAPTTNPAIDEPRLEPPQSEESTPPATENDDPSQNVPAPADDEKETPTAGETSPPETENDELPAAKADNDDSAPTEADRDAERTED